MAENHDLHFALEHEQRRREACEREIRDALRRCAEARAALQGVNFEYRAATQQISREAEKYSGRAAGVERASLREEANRQLNTLRQSREKLDIRLLEAEAELFFRDHMLLLRRRELEDVAARMNSIERVLDRRRNAAKAVDRQRTEAAMEEQVTIRAFGQRELLMEELDGD